MNVWKQSINDNLILYKNVPMWFETEAGKQAQLDRKESMDFILKSGETITINILVLLLSYSRFRVFRVSLSKNQDILLSFFNDAFETFGGVPRELIADNIKLLWMNFEQLNQK